MFYKLPTMLQTVLRLLPIRKLKIKDTIIVALAACVVVLVTVSSEST
jgi:hypothetical protein